MSTNIATENKKGHSVPVLANIWQSQVKQASPDAETSLTPRQFGQLKLLQRGLGGLTAEVIAWTVNNWWTFSLDAMYKAGLPSRPSKPHIGFLLKHYDVAVNLMYERAKAAKSPADLAFISAIDELNAEQAKAWQEEAEWH
jgi:hypothetical protein